MKTTKNLRASWSVTGIALLTLIFSACNKETVSPTETAVYSNDKSSEVNYTYEDPSAVNYYHCIDSLPAEPLSQAEQDALVLMREEELLAHDVYIGLSQLYSKPIFSNISKSEQVHTQAILRLLEKYQVADPASSHVTGTFTNNVLQNLYNSLMSRGSASILDGMIVGATIEDLDLSDLSTQIAITDNEDILIVYKNLSKGSRNHLRSFYANIIFYNGTYTPQYISQQEFDEIISTPHETGWSH